MDLEAHDPEQIEAIMLRNGAHSVTLSDAGDNPVLEPAPGETPLWTDTRITALFDADADFPALERDLRQSLKLEQLPANYVETIADRAWEREWLKDFGPMRFGKRLWIVPGDTASPADDAVVIRLDPGLAFGTGTHPTTALCLEWLDGLDLGGQTVLDFGCGSGVLSVAACRLGAILVEGIDIDLQAVTASRQNAMRNSVEDRFRAGTEIADGAAPFDIVIANILAGTLIDYSRLITDNLKTGGKLTLSGVLSEQVDDVKNAYAEWFDFEPPAIKENWARLTGTKR